MNSIVSELWFDLSIINHGKGKEYAMKRKQTEKIAVFCARCGWRGKRSSTSVWPACPQCGARADLIIPQLTKVIKQDQDLQRHKRVH